MPLADPKLLGLSDPRALSGALPADADDELRAEGEPPANVGAGATPVASPTSRPAAEADEGAPAPTAHAPRRSPRKANARSGAADAGPSLASAGDAQELQPLPEQQDALVQIRVPAATTIA